MNPVGRIVKNLKENAPLRTLLTVNCLIFIIVRISFLIFGMMKTDKEIIFSRLAFPCEPELLIRQPWSILTYMFLQASPLHLIINMIMIYWFGLILTRTRSDNSIIWTYIVSGICGAITYFAAMLIIPFPPGEAGLRLAGASAATLGFAGYAASAIPNLRIRLPFDRSVRLRTLAIILFLISVISGIGLDYGAIAAHCGGFFGGLLIPAAQRKFRHGSSSYVEPPDPSPANMEHRLDSLLEKISVSGYSSLSEKEKSDLNIISSQLKNKGL